MHEALCRPSSTTLDIVHAEGGPPITQRTSGLDCHRPARRTAYCRSKRTPSFMQSAERWPNGSEGSKIRGGRDLRPVHMGSVGSIVGERRRCCEDRVKGAPHGTLAEHSSRP